ncbi:MAG: DUF433 domain-containing protein [Planctomycetes bacterium]|nr:DUF433 domain-containing protein [Planctomycetota bacterium]
MTSDLIHDRGRGPEIVGTRITVYNLLPHLLDATATEAYLCRLYDLSPEQVAAARAYVLNNPETVFAEHLKIEARMSAGNPPEVVNQAKQTRDSFLRFKQWLEDRKRDEPPAGTTARKAEGAPLLPPRFSTFREWLAQQESGPVQGP